MKMIIAIVNKYDSPSVEEALLRDGFYITRLSTTGGFLQSGNTTLLSAVEDDRVDQAISLIGSYSQRRKQAAGGLEVPGASEPAFFSAAEITVGGATVMVVPIERFEKL